MKTTTASMLAGLAALSLGVGTAMAQTETPSMTAGKYWAAQAASAVKAPADNANQIESGSSDPDSVHSKAGRGTAVHLNYGTLAYPG